ncbi:MAG: glycosyltransferase family 2 protein [Roseiflexus sp.]|uniref:glycosyltransferase family 2 protein n=1 Tax=Roseiflexus sp. TaxID=2562120 RepID=UPI0025DD109C|nr:glycosyltransferase family 2 protein [Roseiflexus sp.]MCL6540391.1 glycosyltransferase family 2 protein [Roseiflexus sp.]
MAHSLSVVIPVYRSELIIPLLIQRLTNVLEGITESYEIILVNDGSPDGSWAVIEKLLSEYPAIRAIDLMRNYGQHNALLAGIRAARYDIIVTMDDDLQHPPEEIPRLLAKLDEGYDVVYGAPQKMQHSLLRNLASRITKLVLQSIMGAETARNISAYRVFRTSLRAAFANYNSPSVNIDVLLTWGTRRFSHTPVVHAPRVAGTSNYTLGKLLVHAVTMMTGFSVWPLRIASLLGFVMTAFGLGVLAYVIGVFLILGYSVPGFPFLGSIIAIFSGTQMFILGMIGEYIARIHFRTMDQPSYVVRAIIDGKQSDQYKNFGAHKGRHVTEVGL